MDQDKFDDFDDIDLDDIEDLDDDWDDIEEDGSSDSPMPSPKKKSSLSSLITILIILIFVGVGLFILYTTFKPVLQGNTGAEVPPTETVSQNTPAPTADDNDDLPDPFFAQDDGLPPMPTPLTGSQQIANDPELTPLPEFDDIELEALPNLTPNQAPVVEPVAVQQQPIALPLSLIHI